MITKIEIADQYMWFPHIECSTDPEPFYNTYKYYIVYKDVDPNSIRNDLLTYIMKLNDVHFDFEGDDGYMPLFNLEKVYAYMLRKLLNDKSNNK